MFVINNHIVSDAFFAFYISCISLRLSLCLLCQIAVYDLGYVLPHVHSGPRSSLSSLALGQTMLVLALNYM